MRKYPQNSPQAAARIIALTVVADGDIGPHELDLLGELGVHAQLGLEQDELNEVLDTFCEDLLSSKQLAWSSICPVDDYTLTQLMLELDDPVLRRRVLDLCIKIAEVDGQVTQGESCVLVAAVELWGLHRQMLRLDEAPKQGKDRAALTR
jgi:uncharacterized tellurite resistance protein B-like protein